MNTLEGYIFIVVNISKLIQFFKKMNYILMLTSLGIFFREWNDFGFKNKINNWDMVYFNYTTTHQYQTVYFMLFKSFLTSLLWFLLYYLL